MVTTLTLVALLSGACASSPNATASSNAQATTADQSSAPRQRYWVSVVRVKPGQGDAWQEFYKKETLPTYEKAGYKQVSVFTTATFGEAGEYVTIRPMESLKQFDEPNFVIKALGEAGAKAFFAKRAQLIASNHIFTMESRPELSIPLPQNQIPKLAFVFRQSVAPGRSADFESYVKNDALPLIKKAAPQAYLVTKVGAGGDTEEYHTVTLADSFADYERWTDALQKEGYANKVATKRAGIVLHRELAVYRYLPELSLPQPATQAAK
ncbi:MAG: hypothetical protein JST85_25925 [Acidobacteria bacterium]|nr:hypothetical protein [Acidobacteriota bacterium]